MHGEKGGRWVGTSQSAMLRCRPKRHSLGTLRSSSASQAVALPSEGARQSPRGDSEPPALTFGPFGIAERLNWLKAKKRRRNTSQPLADRRQVVGAAPFGGKPGGQSPAAASLPGVQRQEGDLRRHEAVAQRVVQVEVLQRVGADDGLGALRRLACLGPAPARARSRWRGSRPASPHVRRELLASRPPSGSGAGSASSARRH